MSPHLVELALRKQRLQMRSAALREEWASNVAAAAPLFSVMDGLRQSFAWARSHAPLVVAAGIALLVARPRAAFRWAQRGVIAYRLWRGLRNTLHGFPGTKTPF